MNLLSSLPSSVRQKTVDGSAFEAMKDFIRLHEIGRGATIHTPFGRRLLCYADLTATGRHLRFVEDWLQQLQPYYANTHTAVSSTGRIMTELREEARKVVARSVNAGAEDLVLFVGSGATAAANKLIGLLGLRIPEPLESAFALSNAIPPESRPVVFIGPYEHHSNELPWLESVAEVVEVSLESAGQIDLQDLQRKLRQYRDRSVKIGTFSAASNVTGVLSDVRALARVLHSVGAYACFDYAAAAPYVPINMHPPNPEERIDALFLSTHKFMGGPQGSGVLVAHRSLCRTKVPERPGGGTVDYVAAFERLSVDYTRRLEEREEGGTPAILGDMRAGIVFLIKQLVGPEKILEHEMRLSALATERLSRHRRIRLLGPTDLPRLGILSFNIEGLHHDLVSALLDHLFGIQNRAGCSCAGPYGHRLLGIDRPKSEAYRCQIARGILGIKPGWVRLSLPYYASAEDVEFILQAVEFVADHGQDFVPAYCLGWPDGVWRCIEGECPEVSVPLSLTAVCDAMKGAVPVRPENVETESERSISDQQLRQERARYFVEAHRAAEKFRKRWEDQPPVWNPPTGEKEIDSLIWFRYVHADPAPLAL